MADEAQDQEYHDQGDQQQDQGKDQAKQNQEMVKIFDKKTGEHYEIPKAVQEYFGKSIKYERDKATEKLKSQLEEWQNKYEENAEVTAAIQEQLQELKDAELSAEERAAKKLEKEREKAQREIEELSGKAEQNFNLYKEKTMQTDMFAALSKHDLNNAHDSMKLLMSSGNAEFKQDDEGNWQTVLTIKNEDGELQEMTPVDAAKIYFSQPENQWQLKSSLKPGAGTSQTQRGVNGKSLHYTREQLKDPEIRKEYFERSKNKENVSIIN